MLLLVGVVMAANTEKGVFGTLKDVWNDFLGLLTGYGSAGVAETSVQALACAIDAVAYEQAHAGSFGMDTLDNCNGNNLPAGVEINPNPPTTGTNTITFTYQGSNPHTITIDCDSAADKCEIEDFYLPQEIPGGWKNFIGSAGDPIYLVYNSALPKGVKEDWTIPSDFALVETAMIGAAFGVINIPGVGKKVVGFVGELPVMGRVAKYLGSRGGGLLAKIGLKRRIHYMAARFSFFSPGRKTAIGSVVHSLSSFFDDDVSKHGSEIIYDRMIKMGTEEATDLGIDLTTDAGYEAAKPIIKPVIKNDMKQKKILYFREYLDDNQIDDIVDAAIDDAKMKETVVESVSKGKTIMQDVYSKSISRKIAHRAEAKIAKINHVLEDIYNHRALTLRENVYTFSATPAAKQAEINQVVDFYNILVRRATYNPTTKKWQIKMAGKGTWPGIISSCFDSGSGVAPANMDALIYEGLKQSTGITNNAFLTNNKNAIMSALLSQGTDTKTQQLTAKYILRAGDVWNGAHSLVKKGYTWEKRTWEGGAIAQKYAAIEFGTSALDDPIGEDLSGDWEGVYSNLGGLDTVAGFAECALFFKNTKKGKLYCATVIAASIGVHMADLAGEKYNPTPMNSINLLKVGDFVKEDNPIQLSDEANKYFLQVMGRGPVFANRNRFWLASPCRTNMKVHVVPSIDCAFTDKPNVNLPEGYVIELEDASYADSGAVETDIDINNIQPDDLVTKYCKDPSWYNVFTGSKYHPDAIRIVVRDDKTVLGGVDDRGPYKDKMDYNYCLPISDFSDLAAQALGFAATILADYIGVVAAVPTLGASCIVCGGAGAVAYDYFTNRHWPQE